MGRKENYKIESEKLSSDVDDEDFYGVADTHEGGSNKRHRKSITSEKVSMRKRGILGSGPRGVNNLVPPTQQDDVELTLNGQYGSRGISPMGSVVSVEEVQKVDQESLGSLEK